MDNAGRHQQVIVKAEVNADRVGDKKQWREHKDGISRENEKKSNVENSPQKSVILRIATQHGTQKEAKTIDLTDTSHDEDKGEGLDAKTEKKCDKTKGAKVKGKCNECDGSEVGEKVS